VFAEADVADKLGRLVDITSLRKLRRDSFESAEHKWLLAAGL